MSWRRLAKRAYASSIVLSTTAALSAVLRREPRAVIVNFHQFHADDSSVFGKGPSVHTSVHTLERLLAKLQRRYRFVSLSELVDDLRANQPLSHDSIAITIDDGYVNNLTVGLPVFEKYGIPVTLFVATGFIGTDNMLPMEQLSYIISKTDKQEMLWPRIGTETADLRTMADKRREISRISSFLKSLPDVMFRHGWMNSG